MFVRDVEGWDGRDVGVVYLNVYLTPRGGYNPLRDESISAFDVNGSGMVRRHVVAVPVDVER